MRTILLAALCCLMMSGCYVQSLNKFYTDDLKVELPMIAGDWISEIQMGKDVASKNLTPWKFSKDKIDTYDQENKYAELEAAYFKIAGHLFMDFTAGKPRKDSDDFANSYWGVGVACVHSLCKILIKQNELEIIPMDYDWFKDMISKKKLHLSFVNTDGDVKFIFTASSEQWVAFLKKYADNKGLFNEENKFVFKKKNTD